MEHNNYSIIHNATLLGPSQQGTRVVGKSLWARGSIVETPVGEVFVPDGFYTTELTSEGTFMLLGKLISHERFVCDMDSIQLVVKVDKSGEVTLQRTTKFGQVLSEPAKIHHITLRQDGWKEGLYQVELEDITEDSIISISLAENLPPSEILVAQMACLEGINQRPGALDIRANGIQPIVDIHLTIAIVKGPTAIDINYL